MPTTTVFALLTIITLLSGCFSEPPQAKNDADNSLEQHDHSQHQHAQLELRSIDANAAVPQLSLSVTADSSSGWNIHIDAEHFRFTPEKIDTDTQAFEGHAHLFVDGFKMARLYGPWYHLKTLTPGEHTLRITLNANDHSQWSHEGQIISASQSIIQP